MNATDELLPCPFCGNEDVRVVMTCFGHEYICDACGMHARFHDLVKTGPTNYATMNVVREEADRRWNGRTV